MGGLCEGAVCVLAATEYSAPQAPKGQQPQSFKLATKFVENKYNGGNELNYFGLQKEG